MESRLLSSVGDFVFPPLLPPFFSLVAAERSEILTFLRFLGEKDYHPFFALCPASCVVAEHVDQVRSPYLVSASYIFTSLWQNIHRMKNAIATCTTALSTS